MAEPDFATRARAYIESVELPATPRSGPGLEGAEIDPATSSALAIGQNLVEFTSDASPELRKAITDALLLAQLAADKADTSTPDQWYEAHRSVLMHLGFVSDGLTRTAQDFSSMDADLHEAILPVITAAFAGAAVPAIVIETLKQMSEINQDRPWISLFERESQRFGARQFQISAVNGDPEKPSVSMLGFVLDIAKSGTQVLFLRHANDSVAVERVEGQFSAEASTLLEVAPSLAEKLAARRQSYLQALEI